MAAQGFRSRFVKQIVKSAAVIADIKLSSGLIRQNVHYQFDFYIGDPLNSHVIKWKSQTSTVVWAVQGPVYSHNFPKFYSSLPSAGGLVSFI